MFVASLAIYPVKGLRAVQLDAAEVTRCGLANDRRWAIAGPSGIALTQREVPAMARIDALVEGSALRLECTGRGGIDAQPGEALVTIQVWHDRVPGRAANPEASAWLSAVLGSPCILVYQDDPASRPIKSPVAHSGDVVSLADGFPLLVTTTASLTELNRHLALPVPMDRFRPNLVIEGASTWAEDGWAAIQSTTVRLRLASPCARCKVTTLDQQTGGNPARNEPLNTLSAIHRGKDGRINFGWNAIPESLGTLRTGDTITA